MSAQPTTDTILIGNSFPVSLIRTKVVFEPQPLTALQAALAGKRICSYWGHPNTLAAANRVVGADLTPAHHRPSLKVTANGLPRMGQLQFDECWILAPACAIPNRPGIGEELDIDAIKEWRVLKLTWTVLTQERKP
jgi:hypothetical protein